MDLTVAALTDVGRVRANNEDAHYADADLGLFMVCDGMGGHNAGEVASQTTCDVVVREVGAASRLRERFFATASLEDAEALRRMIESAVGAACREVFKKASKEPELAGMGTTCTLVLAAGHGKGILAHVGDSRLYLHRGGHIHQLTDDHTYVNELIRRGSLARDQARRHPQGNVLSRALGVQTVVAVETMIFDMDPGDTYLLCTDGLHNYFPAKEDLVAGMTHERLDKGVLQLVSTALERGGHDNVTVVALRARGEAVAEVAADRRIAALKRIPLFASLGYNELVRVVGIGQLARAAAGQTIVREGDAGADLFVTLSGEVEVERAGRPVSVLDAGAHFGELGLVGSIPRTATVRARTPAALFVLRRAEFLALVDSAPVIGSKLLWSSLQVLGGRGREGALADGARIGASDGDLWADDDRRS